MRVRLPGVLSCLFLASFAGGCGPRDPGTRVFIKKCSACHGEDGRGRTKFAEGRPYSDLTDGVWKHGGDFDSIRALIAEGDPKSPMPAFKGRLTQEEIDAVTRYVETLAGHQAPVPSEAGR